MYMSMMYYFSLKPQVTVEKSQTLFKITRHIVKVLMDRFFHGINTSNFEQMNRS